MRDWNDFSRDREGTPTILCCWLHDYTNCQSVSHDFYFLSVQHCSSFLLEGKFFSGEANEGLFILSTNLKTRVAFCAQRIEDIGTGLLALHITQASCPTFDSFPEGSPQPISSLHLKLFSSVAPMNLVPSFAPSITALLCLPLGLVTLPSSGSFSVPPLSTSRPPQSGLSVWCPKKNLIVLRLLDLQLCFLSCSHPGVLIISISPSESLKTPQTCFL